MAWVTDDGPIVAPPTRQGRAYYFDAGTCDHDLGRPEAAHALDRHSGILDALYIPVAPPPLRNRRIIGPRRCHAVAPPAARRRDDAIECVRSAEHSRPWRARARRGERLPDRVCLRCRGGRGLPEAVVWHADGRERPL